MSKKKKTSEKKISSKLYKISDNGKLTEILSKTSTKSNVLDLVKDIEKSTKRITELTSPITSITKSLGLENSHIYNDMNSFASNMKKLGIHKNPLLNFTETFKDLGTEITQQEKELSKYWLYNLTVEDLEFTTQRLEDTQQELNHLKNEFRKMYERLEPQPIITSQKTHKYSFECLLSPNELKAIYALCSPFFDCSYNQIVDIFSNDNIDTQIKIKSDITIREIIFLFKSLKENKIIKTKQWANVIVKSECILFNNKPLTAQQIKDARKSLKRKVIKKESEEHISQTITKIK